MPKKRITFEDEPIAMLPVPVKKKTCKKRKTYKRNRRRISIFIWI